MEFLLLSQPRGHLSSAGPPHTAARSAAASSTPFLLRSEPLPPRASATSSPAAAAAPMAPHEPPLPLLTSPSSLNRRLPLEISDRSDLQGPASNLLGPASTSSSSTLPAPPSPLLSRHLKPPAAAFTHGTTRLRSDPTTTPLFLTSSTTPPIHLLLTPPPVGPNRHEPLFPTAVFSTFESTNLKQTRSEPLFFSSGSDSTPFFSKPDPNPDPTTPLLAELFSSDQRAPRPLSWPTRHPYSSQPPLTRLKPDPII